MIRWRLLRKTLQSRQLLRIGIIVGMIGGISLLHYYTAMTHVWLHPLLENAYYVPVLLGAMWFGWRGGMLAAGLSAALYAPFIFSTWGSSPMYSASLYVEIGMFFVIGGLSGALFDKERKERAKVEQTAQKLSEVYSQLQASFEHLRRADRLSALGELSAGLAHEIRNPLGSIEGAARILRRRELAEETRLEFGKMVEDEANRLKDMLNHFLQFARPKMPNPRPTEISHLFETVHRLSAETAKMSGVRVRTEMPLDLPLILVDTEQLTQLMLDLVLNAIQAMPQGGEIVLKAKKQGESAVLEVQDEGVGISPENLEKIFDPFFTTRPTGTGLGLSIAHQIATQHGGRIGVRPNTERGVTFFLTLPLDSRENLKNAETLSGRR